MAPATAPPISRRGQSGANSRRASDRVGQFSAGLRPGGSAFSRTSGPFFRRILHTELAVLSGHREAVTSLAFSPDGKTLASGSYDRTVRLWGIPSGRALRVLKGHTD